MLDKTGMDEFLSGIPSAHVEPSSISGPDDFADSDDEYATNIHGERFDPAIHKGDAQGNPLLTKDGRFRKIPGRKSGSTRRAINDPLSQREKHSEAQLSLAAKTAAAMYINTGVVLFGAEWLPNPEQMEQEQLERAFHDYLETKGIDDIPPSLALIIACFGYAAPRLQKPVTQSRLQRAIIWMKIKYANWSLGRYATRDDIRTNGMRQNNAGETAGKSRGGWWRTRSSA